MLRVASDDDDSRADGCCLLSHINSQSHSSSFSRVKRSAKYPSLKIMTFAEQEFQEAAYSTALIRSLQHGGVKFLRFLTVDVCNNVRCKAVPIEYLLTRNDGVVASLNCLVSVATVCYGGMPFYADIIVQDSGMDARNQIIIKPDLFTLRVLPYAPKTAMVLGTLHDQYSKELSPVCTRGLLAKIVKDAAEKHNIAFVREEAGTCLFFVDTARLILLSLSFSFPSVFKSQLVPNLSFACGMPLQEILLTIRYMQTRLL